MITSLTPADMAALKAFAASLLIVASAALGILLARYGVHVISFAQ